MMPALAMVLVMAFAATLRLPELAAVPLGLHGDEAAAGLEARRIRTDGWIGVYSGVAAGNPTGYYHLVALTTAVFGDSIHSIRLASALVGVATIGVLFALLLRDFGLVAAIAASALLSVSVWHRIFSRMGHVNITWPLIILLATLALRQAIKTGSSAWWSASGAVFAAGIYLYNGHLLFLAAIGGIAAPIVLMLVARGRLAGTAVAAFTIAFTATALPLLTFVATHPDRFVGRAETISLFNSPEWRMPTDMVDKMRFLAGRYVASWDRLSIHPEPTPIDLTGVVPLVPPVALLLSGAGLVLGIARHARHPAVALGAAIVVVMPMMAAVFTDFAMRRAFVIAPFLAMFGGIAVAQLLSIVRNRSLVIRVAMAIGLGCCVLLIGYQELQAFRTTMVSSNTRWALGPELIEVTRFLNRLPSTSFVHFYSVRWPFDHEVVRLLAPAVRGESRGAPFGNDSLDINQSASEHVFVLLDEYRDVLPRVVQRYPGGTAVAGARANGPDDGPSYQAYVLPTMPR
jgi:4-amino-4-deoxy-L-arabinose transferase-like glycosyltransferase